MTNCTKNNNELGLNWAKLSFSWDSTLLALYQLTSKITHLIDFHQFLAAPEHKKPTLLTTYNRPKPRCLFHRSHSSPTFLGGGGWFGG